MINVTCAIIRNEDNEVLTVQRGAGSSNPLKWEFPGGKIKEGESAEECLLREIREELSMEIVICERLAAVEFDYGTKQIKLIPFICDTLDELPVLSEHIAYKWLPPGNLLSVDFLGADVIVAVEYQELAESTTDSDKTITDFEDDLDAEDDFLGIVKNMRSTKEAEWIAASAIETPAVLRKLFEWSYSDDRKLAFHSSWTFSKLFDSNPRLIHPYLDIMTDRLDHACHESARRSFLRILSFTELSMVRRELHGKLADYCLNALNSSFSAVAIKAYSMEILYRLALLYPELANELSASISMLHEESSSGVLARGRIILKKLSELDK